MKTTINTAIVRRFMPIIESLCPFSISIRYARASNERIFVVAVVVVIDVIVMVNLLSKYTRKPENLIQCEMNV